MRDPDAPTGWAERMQSLARVIPGIRGYQDREGLREADKQVRTHLADQLRVLGRSLEEATRRLADAERLERLPAIDRLSRLLATQADRVGYAAYGFAGVFDLHKIREAELAALHQFDLGLVEALARLRGPVQALAEATADDAHLGVAIAAAEQALRAFEGTVAERDALARGL
jgi:hypothetical protein